jgi:hypothetical protein
MQKLRGNGPPVERGDFHSFLQKNTPALKLKLMRSVNSLTDALGLSLVPVMFIVCPLALAVVFHLVRGMYRMPNAFLGRARARISKCKEREITHPLERNLVTMKRAESCTRGSHQRAVAKRTPRRDAPNAEGRDGEPSCPQPATRTEKVQPIQADVPSPAAAPGTQQRDSGSLEQPGSVTIFHELIGFVFPNGLLACRRNNSGDIIRH